MIADQFENTLRQLLKRDPFSPFVVELKDGRMISIERPRIAIGGGGASFFTPEYELVEFTCDETQAIRSTIQGATS